MAARCALLFIGLLLTLQSPVLAKVKSVRSAKASASAAHIKAKIAKPAAHAPQRKADISTQTLEEPAVLEPDGSEDENPPAKALYTDSDDVG